MILPNGNIKKYIKVVIGIYILFSIACPILEKISSKVDVSNILNISDYEEKLNKSYEKVSERLEANNNRNIKDIYKENLENDIKTRLQQKNYGINDLKIIIKDDDKYTISKIEINVYVKNKSKTISNIEVNLEEQKNTSKLTSDQIEEIKRYITETYNISEDIITVS